ncbi:unnamed protein product [Lactuca saligna]|uniref:Uncharacterized protein n=1 Tax=Lactuca saligna TaxID=75948 RepID=A0AA35YXK9_LACSI|nr:unnamed protein product [Lactuca saligna]
MKSGALQLLEVPPIQFLYMMSLLKGLSYLEEENALKSKQISTLQVNLGALSSGYFDLKNKLIVEFGDKFKTIVEDPSATQSSQLAPTDTSSSDLPDDHPPTRTTTIVDRFEIELE